MRIRKCYLVMCFIFAWGVMVIPPCKAESLKKPLLILADVSGTMQEDMSYEEDVKNKRKKHVTKVIALKQLLIRLSRELPPETCDTGIYRVRYLSGNKDRYEQFMTIAAYDQREMTEWIKDEFATDYPVFNRRTPLADMLRQLDEKELTEMNGQITLVLISDGRESFYNLRKDEKESEKQDIKPDDKVRGPLTEVRRLKVKYGANLVMHTIFLDKDKKNEEHEGEILLKRMAELGEGKSLPGRKLVEDSAMLKEFSSLLCEKDQIQVRKAPKAILETIPPTPLPPPAPETEKPVLPLVVKPEESKLAKPGEPKRPEDTDRDGVYDNEDKCPDTPEGCKVNKFGCWVLQGVLFDFDKWNIKTRFYPELDEVVSILEKNPDLKIEIEGHTDNKGTSAYNKILSEKRARSVRKHLVDKGIEPARLSSSGYGFSRPITTNDTSEGRALNRRVELKPVK